jgi:hypothetical protein
MDGSHQQLKLLVHWFCAVFATRVICNVCLSWNLSRGFILHKNRTFEEAINVITADTIQTAIRILTKQGNGIKDRTMSWQSNTCSENSRICHKEICVSDHVLKLLYKHWLIKTEPCVFGYQVHVSLDFRFIPMVAYLNGHDQSTCYIFTSKYCCRRKDNVIEPIMVHSQPWIHLHIINILHLE